MEAFLTKHGEHNLRVYDGQFSHGIRHGYGILTENIEALTKEKVKLLCSHKHADETSDSDAMENTISHD